MPVRIKIHDDKVDNYLYGANGPVVGYVRQLTQEVEREAQRLAPAGSGRLRGSFEVRVERRGTAVVGTITSHLPYAVYVHEGTGLYGPRHQVIRPRSAKVLRFKPGSSAGGAWGAGVSGSRSSKGPGPGGFVFAKYVRGMPSTPYYWLALKAVCTGRWIVRRLPYAG